MAAGPFPQSATPKDQVNNRPPDSAPATSEVGVPGNVSSSVIVTVTAAASVALALVADTITLSGLCPSSASFCTAVMVGRAVLAATAI